MLARIKSGIRRRTRLLYSFYFYVYHHVYLKNKTPVMVFTPGKVGSTSVHESLPDDMFWITSHTINPEKIDYLLQKSINKDIRHRLVHHQQSLQFYRHVVKPRRFAKYITLLRDPIVRNLSAYFQVQLRLDAFDHNNPADIAKLVTEFLDSYEHDVILDWLDVEYKQMLEIDIYQQPFDKERGYSRYDFDNASILIMRTELDDTSKEQAIAEFLDLPDFRLKKANVSAQKDFGDVYRQIKSHAILPADYINRMVDSQYMRHFFTEQEREQTRTKWMQRLEGSAEQVS